jgi:hypothetical protein
MAEMSTSTTIIISIATTTSTGTLAARGKVIGSTTHNTEEMRPMGTGKPRINSVVRALEIAPAAEREIDLVVAELVLQVAELAIDLVAEQELVIDLVAEQELVIDLVAEQELVIDPVAEQELAIDPVAAEQEPGPLRVQLGVALRTKSVTGARRRDLVRLLAAEDLAAGAAETTREPAATEEAGAWEAVDIAVAVVAEDAVAGE